MIEVDGISKRFGKVEAVRSVSFAAEDGRITGLLGPNGAGKSTTLRVLYTVLKPDQGRARIGGRDVVTEALAVRRSMGAMPHGAGLYPQLTARENIAYYGRLHGLEGAALTRRIDEITRLLDLGEFIDRRTKGFSQGQRTRVALARALVHDPQHVLLDEPTNGLDVMATRALRQLILRLRDQGRCVLLSSHVMQEVAALCDRIVIIAHGQVAASGTPDELRRRYAEADLEEVFVRAISDVGERA
ncbi:MAG: ATP-binding cassette domain-containing protein [Gammaproteobacteria bacterium]|nr:ATP-binding cassette domain-containing protein [Gammaproteobacteria bacterium]TVQ47775.1 MAG: ATP-binding cassette domain-containing protein [Gammaproteobacteria bacterium]